MVQRVRTNIPRTLPYYDNVHIESPSFSDPIAKDLKKLYPHRPVVVAEGRPKSHDFESNPYQAQLYGNGSPNDTSNDPDDVEAEESIDLYSLSLLELLNLLLEETHLDDSNRISIENSLLELTSYLPKPLQSWTWKHASSQASSLSNEKQHQLKSANNFNQSDPIYPNGTLSKIVIDNYTSLLRFSSTYFNLSLASHITRYLVELIYSLQYWEVYHLLYMLPNLEYFLKLIDFEVVDTVYGPLVRPPENYLKDSMLSGLQYPFPYPFYNYSYHSFAQNVDSKKYNRINTIPYEDITLKDVLPPKKRRGRPKSISEPMLKKKPGRKRKNPLTEDILVAQSQTTQKDFPSNTESEMSGTESEHEGLGDYDDIPEEEEVIILDDEYDEEGFDEDMEDDYVEDGAMRAAAFSPEASSRVASTQPDFDRQDKVPQYNAGEREDHRLSLSSPPKSSPPMTQSSQYTSQDISMRLPPPPQGLSPTVPYHPPPPIGNETQQLKPPRLPSVHELPFLPQFQQPVPHYQPLTGQNRTPTIVQVRPVLFPTASQLSPVVQEPPLPGIQNYQPRESPSSSIPTPQVVHSHIMPQRRSISHILPTILDRHLEASPHSTHTRYIGQDGFVKIQSDSSLQNPQALYVESQLYPQTHRPGIPSYLVPPPQGTQPSPPLQQQTIDSPQDRQPLKLLLQIQALKLPQRGHESEHIEPQELSRLADDSARKLSFQLNSDRPREKGPDTHEKERVEKERVERERTEREKTEKEKIESERIESERVESERIEKERIAKSVINDKPSDVSSSEDERETSMEAGEYHPDDHEGSYVDYEGEPMQGSSEGMEDGNGIFQYQSRLRFIAQSPKSSAKLEGGEIPMLDDKKKNKSGVIHQCHLIDPGTLRKCLKIFYGKNELLRHQEFVHATKKKIYKCIYCSRNGAKVQSYPRHDSLARHIRRKHGVTGKENKMAVNYAKENVEVIDDPKLLVTKQHTFVEPLPHPQFLNPDFTIKSSYAGFLLFSTKEVPNPKLPVIHTHHYPKNRIVDVVEFPPIDQPAGSLSKEVLSPTVSAKAPNVFLSKISPKSVKSQETSPVFKVSPLKSITSPKDLPSVATSTSPLQSVAPPPVAHLSSGASPLIGHNTVGGPSPARGDPSAGPPIAHKPGVLIGQNSPPKKGTVLPLIKELDNSHSFGVHSYPRSSSDNIHKSMNLSYLNGPPPAEDRK